MTLMERYNQLTPLRWQKIGRAISHLQMTLQTTLAGFEAGGVLPVEKYWWLHFVIALIGWGGQTLTDFATPEKQDEAAV